MKSRTTDGDGHGKLKPRTSIDDMKIERFVVLALYSAAALATSPGFAWSDSSSSGSSWRSDSRARAGV